MRWAISCARSLIIDDGAPGFIVVAQERLAGADLQHVGTLPVIIGSPSGIRPGRVGRVPRPRQWLGSGRPLTFTCTSP